MDQRIQAGGKDQVQRIIIELGPQEPAKPEPKDLWPGAKLFLIAIALALLAFLGFRFRLQFPELLPLVMGVLGGLMHELAQSGGVIHLPRKLPDGEFYLGSLVGAVLGGAAGLFSMVSGMADPLAPVLGGFTLKSGFESLASIGNVRASALRNQPARIRGR